MISMELIESFCAWLSEFFIDELSPYAEEFPVFFGMGLLEDLVFVTPIGEPFWTEDGMQQRVYLQGDLIITKTGQVALAHLNK